MTLLYWAIESLDIPLIKQCLEDCSRRPSPQVQVVINQALLIAIGHRESFEVMELILNAKPDQRLVDSTFQHLASLGTCPHTLRLIQRHISHSKLVEANRKHVSGRGVDFYLVDIFEEEAAKDVDRKLFSRFHPKNRRAANLCNRLMDQAFVNELFLSEVRSAHHLVVQNMLSPSDPAVPRPDQTTLTKAFQYAVLRGKYQIAHLIAYSDEGPLQVGGGFRLQQQSLDAVFRAACQTSDLTAMTWLLGQHMFSITSEVIDELYVEWRAHARHHRPTLDGLLGWRRSQQMLRALRDRNEAITDILASRASEEALERIKQAELRQVRIQQAMARLSGGMMRTDIHAFSHARVEAEGEEEASPQPQAAQAPRLEQIMEEDEGMEEDDEAPRAMGEAPNRRTLNGAVRAYLSAQVPAGSVNIPHALSIISQHVESIFSSTAERRRAESLLSEGLAAESLNLLALAVTFLTMHHPDSISLWLQGFLVEAVQMNSCNPGVVERIVTGLRGVGDPQLDRLFQQVEGPALASYFLNNTFNITFFDRAGPDYSTKLERARRLAQVLADRGLNESCSETDLTTVLSAYAKENVETFLGEGSGRMDSSIASVIEVVVDCFDDFIKVHLQEICAKRRQEQQEQEHPDEGPGMQHESQHHQQAMEI